MPRIVEDPIPYAHSASMTTVQQIKTQLENLSPAELLQIRDWLDNVLEDHLPFTDAFEAQIKQTEREMISNAPGHTSSPPEKSPEI
jgi:hypothetical protein